MSKITVKGLESFTIEDDGRTIREDGGLVGRVRSGPRGITVLFRYEFKLQGDKRDYALGSWPKKSLADIRSERDRLRVIVADGIDPTAAKKASRIEKQKAVETTLAEAEQTRVKNSTVRDLFEMWAKEGVARRDENKELRRHFEKDILQAVGHIELRKLTDTDIRTMLRKLLGRGVTRTAIIAFNDLGQMLRWGEKRQPWRGLLADGNPIDLVDMEILIPADYEEERDRILPPNEIRELANIFSSTTATYESAVIGTKRNQVHPIKRETQLALWICLGTLCRIGELLMARSEHIDLDAGTWFIPRSNVKGRRQEHVVYLSEFARRHFTELLELAGGSEWLFASRNKGKEETHVCVKSVSKQVGDRQTRFKNRSKPLANRRNDNSLILGDGVNGAWTPHDLRRTGATMMQKMGIPLDIIDRCQNHVIAGSKVRRHYLHHDYAEEKTDAWRKLGDSLDVLLNCTQN
ncbi:tyrosine-type recombinase/integrase [Herbaspirillum lusitanum]|uniref:Tyrosine-type recombinase/integrase n=1 Tax=Herbaspirillum lusitanum TaxID=213312 RepID=A0ABW9A5Q4_9BURK